MPKAQQQPVERPPPTPERPPKLIFIVAVVALLSVVFAVFPEHSSRLVCKALIAASDVRCYQVTRTETWLEVHQDVLTKKQRYSYKFPMQGNTADFVILAADVDDSAVGKPLDPKLPKDKLSVLLIKRGPTTIPVEMRGLYSTPGGFMESNDVTFDDTAKREVVEEAGLHGVIPTQLFVASKLGRDPRYAIDLGTRVISVYFGAIVQRSSIAAHKLQTSGAEEGEVLDARFIPLNDVPDKMAFDHRENLLQAIDLIRGSRNGELVIHKADAQIEEASSEADDDRDK